VVQYARIRRRIQSRLPDLQIRRVMASLSSPSERLEV